jgi:hypothetical protein
VEYGAWVRNPEEKRHLKTLAWENNIKMDLQEVGWNDLSEDRKR